MATKPPASAIPGPALPEAKATSGATCSLACNLPHGLLVVHAGRKLTINGGNHPRAIKTGLAVSAKWGITHDVDEEWYDDWVKAHNVAAVRNGHIVKNTKGKIVAQAEATGDSVKTGADALNPLAPKEGTGADVEQAERDED